MASKAKKNSEKGATTEEKLAAYFRSLGYFVARGVEFYYKGQSVTDIDLWLYTKYSRISKEITIVDIKNKRTPQAYERMLWTKGLQMAVKADKAIVATTETKKEILEFGKKLDITVLGGNVLKKINNDILIDDRISEEEFQDQLKNSTFGKLDGDWKGRVSKCKALLSSPISFNTINYWLEEAGYFANQVVSRPKLQALAIRCLYIIISYICIGIDKISEELVYENEQTRYELLKNGFTYGNQGINKIKQNIEQSILMIKQYGNIDEFSGESVRNSIYNVLDTLGTGIVAEYFCKQEVLEGLMELAIEFEHMGMNRLDPTTFSGSPRCRSLVGCLLDFWQIDRVKFGLIPPK